MSDPIFEKKCVGECGRTLPLSEFPTRTAGKDGHRNECKQCAGKFRAEWESKPEVKARRAQLRRARRIAKSIQRKDAEKALSKLPLIGPVPDKQCTGQCGRVLPITSFDRQKAGKFGRRTRCKFCQNIYQRERRRRNPEVAERQRLQRKGYRVKNGDTIRARDRKRRKEPYTRARHLADSKAWRERLKTECFDAYGGCCSCCRETDYRLLTLDHVNSDGAEHRKQIKAQRSWTVIYQWAKENGYPPNLRILCWTCNNGAYRNLANPGICPHQQEFNIVAMAMEQQVAIAA